MNKFIFSILLIFINFSNMESTEETTVNTIDNSNNTSTNLSVFSNSLNGMNIYIQATYYGGCGYSIMIKKKTLDTIKQYLIDNYKINEQNIKTEMLNLKTKSNLKEDIDKFNETEFNIFLIFDNKRKLIGTSDSNNINGYYYKYLQYGNILEKENFLKTVSQNLIKFLQNEIINTQNITKNTPL
jgi:hypothetical protein